MSLAITAFNQIVIMFFIIVVGIICYKTKLIDNFMNKKLSDLVLYLVNPFVFFVSYQRKFEASLLRGLLISLLLAIVTHAFGIMISCVLVRKKQHVADITIERFAVIYSNSGFIGIPLVNGVFGGEGVFYLTAYLTIFNLVVWTHGMITMSGKSDKKTMAKAFLSPSIIAALIGFFFFICRIILPDIAVNALYYIANLNTPLALLVAGVTIAQTNFIKIFGKLRIYYIAFLKLLFVPIAMLILFQLFDIPRIVILTSVLAAACPTAATINLFSIKYDKNYLYASELFAMTTILSLITIPLVMIIAKLFV